MQAIIQGDKAAATTGGRKTVSERLGTPVFDVIIELRKENINEWILIHNVSDAVDRVLNSENVPVEIRTRNPDTGHFTLVREERRTTLDGYEF